MQLMNISPLDQDPFEVESWESLYRFSLKHGLMKQFKKKLNDHIVLANALVQKQYDKYIMKRMAEIKAEEIKKGT